MIHVGHTFRTVDLLIAEAVPHDDHVDYRLLAGNDAGQVSMWTTRGFLLGLAADVGDLLAMVPQDRSARPTTDDDSVIAIGSLRPAERAVAMELDVDVDEAHVLFLPDEGVFVLEIWDRDQPPEAPPALSFYPSRIALVHLRGSILAACASRAGECCACGQAFGPVPLPTSGWSNGHQGGRGARPVRHDRGGRPR